MRSVLNFETEQWKPIAGHETAYEVSNLGRVRSLLLWKGWGGYKVKRSVPKILRQFGRKNSRWNYPEAGIAQRNRTVHSLVMEAFVGPRPPGRYIDHIDGNPRNNNLSNLRYCSQSENLHNKHARKPSGKTSRYVGVCFQKEIRRWTARIQHRGRFIHIGCYRDEQSAAAAYQSKKSELAASGL